ncbi:hypothetical protein [Paenibacillus sp.]|uniref:hypothetical protein n=1 Tax=Paenibacillus sp. TaxID=58172 RepID=UPI00282B86E2|nr:hypothetical protein [Paenibacillus sp.]MDR0268030.1 hypothetical protein [Paenibacillus sp.]
MAALVALLDILKWIATILSLVFSIRKLYRWIKRKLYKRKTHRKRLTAFGGFRLD